MRTRTVALLTAALLTAALAVSAVAAAPVTQATVKDFSFQPGRLAVARGTKVVWRFATGAHNVTVTRGPVRFHSLTQARGTYSHIFTRGGTYQLICTIHPFMRETVVVR